MTSIARVHLTRNKKHCNSAQTNCRCLQWCYWICMQRGYSSVVEHSAAVREVPVRTRVSPCIIFERLREMTSIARVHLTRNKKLGTSAQTTWACLQWYYWICMQRGYSSVVEQITSIAAVREVPGPNPGVPLYNFWKTREKWHRSREYTWLGTKNLVCSSKLQVFAVMSIESVCTGI